MGMKLLDKSEITKVKNTDRAREVAEGLKLSRRVDSLRELNSKEEENLEKFRNESLTAINKEISERVGIRDRLTIEIGNLQSKLDSLLPGMETERKGLNERKLKLEKEEENFQRELEELNLKEIDIAIALKNAEDDAERSATHRERAEKLHGEAQSDRDTATQILQKAKSVEDNTTRLRKETEDSLASRENEISTREKTLLVKEQGLVDRERGLSVREIQVADQRATLERALERLRKNRLG